MLRLVVGRWTSAEPATLLHALPDLGLRSILLAVVPTRLEVVSFVAIKVNPFCSLGERLGLNVSSLASVERPEPMRGIPISHWRQGSPITFQA